MASLNDEIIACRACPRLVDWREKVALEKRRAFVEETYWGRAVPNFGDPNADRLIVGLAPAAHGANRTGRMFTGDRSGDWLYRALFRAGAATQPTSEYASDGLALNNVLITAICHCAPPDNKPLPTELLNCQPFLVATLQSRSWHSILCLGSLAWNQMCNLLGARPRPTFAHGSTWIAQTGTRVLGSYHPSQQNTFTGRLTEAMLDDVVQRFVS